MDSTVSISKGVFVFKNQAKPKSKKSRKKKEDEITSNIFAAELWYKSYSKLWHKIEKNIRKLNTEMFSSILSNLVSYLENCYLNAVTEIPSVALLTGINMPDHAAQFTTLGEQIKKNISPHVVVLYSDDCPNIKTLMENMINQILSVVDSNLESDDSDGEIKIKKYKKSQYNISLLRAWYENQYINNCSSRISPKKHFHRKNIIAIIIPDFESFDERVLQEFILIISSYINILPFVLIFGVATSLSILHKSLPYRVSSKISIQVFNSQPSTSYLNNVVENVLFSEDCPFRLNGKVFTLFTDVFLFYDLSVTGFIQNYKFTMLEHFSQGNQMALCCSKNKIDEILDVFTHEDFENVRYLLTFRRLVENEKDYDKRIKLIEDDTFFRPILKEELLKLHKYLSYFHLFIKCLYCLTYDLPKSPLGKQVRELYSTSASNNICATQEYKECFQLLNFQSKDELMAKLNKICVVLESKKDELTELTHELRTLRDMLKLLDSLNLEDNEKDIEVDEALSQEKIDRKQLKEKLFRLSQMKPMNKYEKIRAEILEKISLMFSKYLYEPSQNNFFEIFFFSDTSIHKHIIGSQRAGVHTALIDPQYYLKCSCCELPNDSTILRSMPDVCIMYKLHLEYGKMINLYDWLQAFLSVVDPINLNDEDEEKDVDPALQARFTQAVAELEFLGFIKNCKRKADHVLRLTWGG